MGLFGGNRSVKIGLIVDPKGAVAGLATFRKAAGDLTRDLEKAATKHKRAFNDLGSTFTKVGLGLTAFAGVAVVSAAQFDKAMSRAKAATQATANDMNKLRQAAIIAGRDTQYSATEAADGITEMAKAGVSTQDILNGGLRASLNLAAAGELSVADAANISATAMTQFNLKGKDLGLVTDYLAAGAGKAQGSVQDLALALQYVGPVANSLGMSIDQTIGSLAELASQGLVGEKGGTALRGMLMSLSAPSKAARTEMDALGISVFDAQGKFIGADGAAQALQNALGKMTDAQRSAALGTIFGNEQIAAANIVLKGGAKSAQDWTAKVHDIGFASHQAGDLMDNLAGDVEQLKGSLETAFITGGSGATGGLRDLVNGARDAVDAFGALPPIVQESTVAIAGLSGAGLLVAGGLIKAVTTVVEFKKTLKELSVAADGSKTKFGSLLGALGGPWGIALAAGTVALGYFLKQSADAAARVNDLTQAIESDSGAIGENTRAAVAKQVADSGMIADARQLGVSTDEVTRAALGHSDALASVRAQLEPLTKQMSYQRDANGQMTYAQSATAKAASDLMGALNDQSGSLTEAQQKAKDYQSALDATTPAGEKAANGITKVGVVSLDAAEAAKKAADALNAFKDAIDAAFGYLDIQAAQDHFVQGLKDMAEAAGKAHGKLVGNGEAVMGLREAIRGQVDDATAWLKMMSDQGASQDEVARKAVALKNGIMQAGTAAGISGPKLAAMLKGFESIPGVKEMEIRLKTDPAMHSKKEFDAEIKKIPRSILTQLKADPTGATLKSKEARAAYRAIPPWVLTHIKAEVSGALTGVRQVVTAIQNVHDKTVTIRTVRVDSSGQSHVSSSKARAGGGIIPGPPSSADNRIAVVRQTGEQIDIGTGEFVVNSRQTAKHRGLLEDINAGRRGFDTGGFVASEAMPFALSDVRSRYDATLPKPITAAQVTAAENRARNAALAVDKAERDLGITRRKHPRDVNAIRDAEDRLDKARRAQAAARTGEAAAIARQRAPRGFNLGNYLTQLEGTARNTRNYRRDLAVVGKRGGSQLAALLEAEGGGSADLVHALARATPAQLARALKSLRSMNPSAFAPVATASTDRVFNFASGGTYGVNAAQVAPDGAYRVWAEKGTGGEAYIPLGAGNRARSRMVASEVVARLGGSVAWSTARPSGAGQVSALPSAAGGLAGRSGPLMQVGTITQTSGTPHEIAADLMFNLRTMGY